mmetsp:Transcript_41946/g.139458  ORF Transcript_41946/g.139458 Transcript_41946/m.139458 type:complete len:249 (-) Transcript_41946:15-761(-)
MLGGVAGLLPLFIDPANMSKLFLGEENEDFFVAGILESKTFAVVVAVQMWLPDLDALEKETIKSSLRIAPMLIKAYGVFFSLVGGICFIISAVVSIVATFQMSMAHSSVNRQFMGGVDSVSIVAWVLVIVGCVLAGLFRSHSIVVTLLWSLANYVWVSAVDASKDYTFIATLSFVLCILLGLWAWYDETGFAITHYPAAPPFPPSPPLPPSPPPPPLPEWWSLPNWVLMIISGCLGSIGLYRLVRVDK